MQDRKALMTEIYGAFNRRDIDGALRLMSDAVSWPKASEGGRVVGKEAIRAYWTRQWAEFDPRVDVMDVSAGDGGTTEVRVRQVVKDLQGNLLADGEVMHVFTIADGLIVRMDVLEDGVEAGAGASAAFQKH